MNHYPHHIGDFNTATLHLSRLERAVYRDMLDMYYDKEAPLDGTDFDLLARRLRCFAPEDVAALQFVLNEYFEQSDDGYWSHARCDQEIAQYRVSQTERGVVLNNESERKKRSRANRAAMCAALRAKGVSFKFNVTMTALRALCKQHDIALPIQPQANTGAGSGDGGGAHAPMPAPAPAPVTGSVTAQGVTGHGQVTTTDGSGTGIQNQNHNQLNTPQPPTGGDAVVTATSLALSAHFPEHRRERMAAVTELINGLVSAGTVTADTLLQAASRQASNLNRDGGKACPSVLRWLRDQRWLDVVALPAEGAAPADWRATRSGIEAMAERVGMCSYQQGCDQGKWRLFAEFERAVEQALAGQVAA